MKKTLTIIFLLITSFLFAQQNLVPNWSFEDTIRCPDNYSQTTFAKYWYTNINSTDYFNSCSNGPYDVSVPNNFAGYQVPPTGNAYCGLLTYEEAIPGNSEFLGTKLIQPLIIGQKYFVSFKVSRSDIAMYNCAVNNIGLLFTNVFYKGDTIFDNGDTIMDIYAMYTPLPIVNNFAHIYSPNVISDTANWTIISGTFTADSAYQYFLIGRFFDDAHSIISCQPTTMDWAYYYIDDICISSDSTVCDMSTGLYENNSNDGFNIFPNPTTNNLTIDFTVQDKYVFELYDLLGAKRLSVRLDSGSKTVDLTDIVSGLYFYSVFDSKGDKIITDKLIIIK